MIATNLIRKIGSHGGLPPPRAPGPSASGANRGPQMGGRPEAAPPPIGAGGAWPGGSGGREPPPPGRPEGQPPQFCVPSDAGGWWVDGGLLATWRGGHHVKPQL